METAIIIFLFSISALVIFVLVFGLYIFISGINSKRKAEKIDNYGSKQF